MFFRNAEDFPKVAVDTYPTVVIGVKFVSTFVDWGDQSVVPNIGEDARAKDDVKEFLECVVCIFDHFWVGGFLFCPVAHSRSLENPVGSGSL